MEKIKPWLEMLKKHHFWLLAGLCLVIILYCWNSAAREITEQFQANQLKVDSEFSKIQKLSSRPQFPNPQWEKEVLAKDKEVLRQIEKASGRIVKQQEPVLSWSDTFSPAFIEVANEQSPLEWPDEAMAEFRWAMPKEVERLRKIVGAAESQDDPGVQWNPTDYQKIQEAFSILPAKEVVMTMRNRYWAFESLAKIVAATNAGTDDKFNLPIHNLEVMAVGDERAGMDPEAWQLEGLPAAAAAGQPTTITGYQVWPFRLQVRMNLEHLDRLLTACANSELALDVTGLRFEHPNRTVEVKQEQPEQRPRFRGGMGGFGGRAPSPPPPEEEMEKPEATPSIPPRGTLVEITGVVYIANQTFLKTKLAKPVKAAAVTRPARRLITATLPPQRGTSAGQHHLAEERAS
ncbi:MAG: hypothetical protein GTO03_03455 [Planctomycetales bacterium]|nr:hypothetical protein [Planctomycetales bacterium]